MTCEIVESSPLSSLSLLYGVWVRLWCLRSIPRQHHLYSSTTRVSLKHTRSTSSLKALLAHEDEYCLQTLQVSTDYFCGRCLRFARTILNAKQVIEMKMFITKDGHLNIYELGLYLWLSVLETSQVRLRETHDASSDAVVRLPQDQHASALSTTYLPNQAILHSNTFELEQTRVKNKGTNSGQTDERNTSDVQKNQKNRSFFVHTNSKINVQELNEGKGKCCRQLRSQRTASTTQRKKIMQIPP